MLKRVLVSTASLLVLTGIASAADLPSRMAPPLYAPPPLPIFTWTGGYFGVNAGYAFDHEGQFNTTENVIPGPGVFPTRGFKVSDEGFTAGGQIGYNYQFGGSGLVVGFEADASYTDLDRSKTVLYAPGLPSLAGTQTTSRSGLDYLATVRGRVGYSFGQLLVYGTGGFAFGGVNNSVAVAPLLGGPSFAGGSRSDMETGYAYGGGIEYALPTTSFLNFFKSSAVTLKAEYLHYDLGSSKIAVNTPGGVNFANAKVSNEGDLARVGLNYKFGSY